MPRPLPILAALVVVIAIMAVRLAPATLADSRIAELSQGALRMGDAEGTIWDGRGTLIAGAIRVPVAWRLAAVPLLRGGLQLQLVPDTGTGARTPRADITLQGQQVALRDVEAILPVPLLVALAPTGSPWTVGGDLDLSATTLVWAPPANSGEARIQWRRAQINIPGRPAPLDLGAVTLVLNGAGDRLSGPVSNTGGDLAIRGDFALAASSGVQVSLVVTPRRADNRELAQALSALGPPDGDGWRLTWQMPLRERRAPTR